LANGLHWIRRQQRTLARVVLGLFVLAWLQVAAIPCTMADEAPLPAAAAHSSTAHHCQYCPPAPGGSLSGGDHQGTCLYPHGAQLDSRASAGLFFVLPAAMQVVRLEPAIEPARDPGAARAALIPRPPLADSLCRRIE
jgi:hypothetical protein